ncbi:hypothetical protein Taro_001449 [Colocasia esculenta]|uniref:Uncharacterized protein n=1 Tax=Colocasia esculenta TaxID=4460 RepID=A0A843TDN4_COLES|nr:hypothetical protein [Colocasia esculenta]
MARRRQGVVKNATGAVRFRQHDHDNGIVAIRSRHGRVEELLVDEELWNDHKKLIFFPFSSAATCTNRPLEIDQRFFGKMRLLQPRR